MKKLEMVALSAVLVAGLACAPRNAHAVFPDLKIPVGCASEITLVGCDLKANPPRCRNARVRYRAGCEEIVVGK